MAEKIKQMKKENEKKPIIKRTALRTFIAVFSLIVLILSLITLASTVKAQTLAFGRYRFFIMRAESYPQIAEVGDLVIAQKLEPGELKIGDPIVYGDNKEVFYCNNIINVKKSNIVNKVVLAEKNGVSYQFSESEISGKVIKNIHKLGNIITFLRTPVGIILFLLFVVCLFALLRILVTYNKHKYENN